MQRYAEESLPLAEAAATRSLDLATIRPKSITHLITVSCTGLFVPGFDIGLVRRLGLSPDESYYQYVRQGGARHFAVSNRDG